MHQVKTILFSFFVVNTLAIGLLPNLINDYYIYQKKEVDWTIFGYTLKFVSNKRGEQKKYNFRYIFRV